MVFLFNLLWFGLILSFPLFGEDGAHSYSSLVETLIWGPGFPLKLLDGLGQINLFTAASFDPFSWVMFCGSRTADLFRLSYAIRATFCWIATYAFVRVLVGRARWIAAASAALTMLLSFTLAHPWGALSFLSIPIATQLALFPAVLWLYMRVLLAPRLLSWRDLAFACGIAIFLVAAPIASLIGLAAVFLFGISLLLTAHRTRRRACAVAVAKLFVISAVILFGPVYGVYRAWSAVIALSARDVYSRELTTYALEYLPPHFWHDVPLGVRAIVLLALAGFALLRWRRIWPVRAVVVTLAAAIALSQATTVLRAGGVWSALLGVLPRPFYVEVYLPVFYGITAAYALHRWWRFTMVRPSPASFVRVGAFAVGTAIVINLRSAVSVIGAAAVLWMKNPWPVGPRPRWIAPVSSTAAIAMLVVGAPATLLVWPEGVHPVFAQYLVCQKLRIWCQDPAGPSMGAGSNEITRFLRSRLSAEEGFRGRAEFLMVPPDWTTEPEVSFVVQARDRNFVATGNGMLLRALPLQGIAIASSYDPALDHLYFFLWTRYVNEGVPARRSVNMTVLESVRPDRLALIGVRYIVAPDSSKADVRRLRKALSWRGYSVYEIDAANVAGYAPTEVIFAKSLAKEIYAMQSAGFNPRRVAVMGEGETELRRLPWSNMEWSTLRVKQQTLTFEGKSAGAQTLVVLPFRFSHCWRPSWNGPAGRVVRVNAALLGLVFQGTADVRLQWSSGYGPSVKCLEADVALLRSYLAI